MWPRTSLLLIVLPLFPFSSAATPCLITANGISYDIRPLSGLRTCESRTETPPTKSEARVRMDLCGDEGLNREDGIDDDDQCPHGARVCVKLINIKPAQDDRVTSVVPLWMKDTPETNTWYTPLGTKGRAGLEIWVDGPDYAGGQQALNLTLRCDQSAEQPNPAFISYTSGKLSLEWNTPDACPRDSLDGDYDEPYSSGWSFWGFVKFIFWASVLGIIAYFVIGIFYNHQQYSARGWDLIPHKDFWREVPTMAQDLTSHVFSNVRSSGGGGGGRGGYSSLG